MAPLIEFNRVSKAYRLRRESPTAFRDFFIRGLQGQLRPPAQDQLWAVREVSFAIEPGETVGFIGDNGAGKSTTLKLISQLIVPTQGRVRVNGRVSALLELGTGFHPELSGRDNVFLSGSLIGLSQRDIRRKFDSIVAFSELEAYIDMPVKHYSSGMFARLAFAVSIHLDPEILLVDEVLAVGDMAFQQKCFDKISELKSQGITIIMVSHSHGTITQHCTRALWLQHGRLMADGYADSVVRRYVENVLTTESERMMLAAHTAQAAEVAAPEPVAPMDTPPPSEESASAEPALPPSQPLTPPWRWGNSKVTVDRVYFTDIAGQEAAIFKTGKPWTLNMDFTAHERIPELVFGMAIHRHDGVHVCGPNMNNFNVVAEDVLGAGKVTYTLPRLFLLDGLYHVTISAHTRSELESFDYHDRKYTFRVDNQVMPVARERYGLVVAGGRWQVSTATGQVFTSALDASWGETQTLPQATAAAQTSS